MHAQVAANKAKFVNPPRTRRVGIIGAGPGGMATAVRLKEAGYEDITLLEKSAGPGGTWYNNRYPGLCCDVPSHLYSFSFDLNPRWSRAYSPQPEILTYMDGVADRHDLRRHIRCNSKVAAARWNDECGLWHVELATGEVLDFEVLVAAQGMFNDLNWPKIEGMESFNGILFHSGDWPAHCDLNGKRVAIIGSAASAVQMVPEIAKEADRLDVYQRSPNWVLPKDDPIFTEEEKSGRETRPLETREMRLRLYREMDSFCTWTELSEETREEFRQTCLANLANVHDPELRAKMTPDVPWGATRPLFSNDFYPAFNRNNVALITDPIARITPNGIADGTGIEREYDVIICATGYKTDRYASAISITGRGGQEIADAWKDGATAYLGITTANFPNLFMIYGPNTNNGSILFMLECQAAYIARHVQWMDANDISWIEVKSDVERRYNEELQAAIDQVGAWKSRDNYYHAASGRNVTQYPFNMTIYRELTMTPDWDNFRFQYGVAL